MSDIVERLRTINGAAHGRFEAIAEIDRLRSALREAERLKLMWRKWYDNEVEVSEGLRAQLVEARAALGEKA